MCLYIFQNLKEQQTQRTPQYEALMQALITKMDPQLQSKLGLLSEKWIRVKEETYTWHKMWVFLCNQRLQLQVFAGQVCVKTILFQTKVPLSIICVLYTVICRGTNILWVLLSISWTNTVFKGISFLYITLKCCTSEYVVVFVLSLLFIQSVSSD